MKKTLGLSLAAVFVLAACSDNDEMPMNDENGMMDENNMPADEEDMPMDDEDMQDNENMPMNEENMHDNEDMPMDENNMHDDEDMPMDEEARADYEEEAASLPDSFQEGASENRMSLNTKNVTRLTSADPESASIEAAQTIWPATHEANRPGAVLLADPEEWQEALSILTLVHHPNDGPLLLMEDGLSEELLTEIERLNPLGTEDGTEILTAGTLSSEEEEMLSDYSIQSIEAETDAGFAREADAMFAEAMGETPEAVLIGSSADENRLFSQVAGSWIAHMNEPLLYVDDEVPQETIDALETREEAVMYLLGGEDVISSDVEEELSEYGTVERIEGSTPQELSIAFAQYEHDGFGWNINSPGHGFVFTSSDTPDLALAGAPFAHLGKHAPLLWLEGGELTQEHADYLATVKPGYMESPMEGPYNHSYMLGGESDISFSTQGVIDAMMEIEAVDGGGHGGH
ncbi:cell wall-binding repeat-containing protein [Alkalicoccus urumqiensis]|uniref:ArsR family transcriptional regulator n=1 Tax=Alkalicoccus urumqiensis TaxID=1548213 RepID=A0A2P6MIG6_ALKUR|nr:cell wall-binding repeat-containing protein [Alkalicoccus urumqiensis]PRO66057.1 ArsR family transcriptional regulator [Alkalicoccus urumqiensis]